MRTQCHSLRDVAHFHDKVKEHQVITRARLRLRLPLLKQNNNLEPSPLLLEEKKTIRLVCFCLLNTFTGAGVPSHLCEFQTPAAENFFVFDAGAAQKYVAEVNFPYGCSFKIESVRGRERRI